MIQRAVLPIVLAVQFIAACTLNELPFKEDYDLLRSIKVGMSEAEVRERLGDPVFTHGKGISAEEYCVKGRACDRHPISNRLLVFIRGEPIAYVFLDDQSRVEHVYVGGS